MSINEKVSVIIPIYKTEKHINECVTSVVNQTYKNMEIILVDDGSPDNCPAICDDWAEKDNRIKVIHKDNAGVSAARNTGIEVSTGEWILFVDSDDVVSEYLLEALCTEAGEKRLLVSAEFMRFKDKLPPQQIPPFSVKETKKDSVSMGRSGYYSWGTLYKKEFLERFSIKFDYRIKNLEDVVWNGMYMMHTNSSKLIDAPLYFYRENPDSVSSMCVDSSWQVLCWFMARNSLLNSFSEIDLSRYKKKRLLKFFRYCRRNIYAECYAGKITYNQLTDIEKTALKKVPCCDKALPTVVRILNRAFSHTYYRTYSFIFKLITFLH